MIFQPNQTLLFIGDSITDCGHRIPPHRPLGDGYVRIVHDWLSATQPHLNLTLLNKGISGDTSRDLRNRWLSDVIRHQPDWLFIKIGVNDVWRTIDNNLRDAVPRSEYEHNYRHWLDWTRNDLPATQLILIEPFLVEPNRQDPFRAELDTYRAVVQQLSEEYGARLVELQAPFDRGLQHQSIPYWAGDRVHPTAVGHTLIAHEILRVCGCL